MNEITKRKDVAGSMVKALEASFTTALPSHVTREHFARALLTEFRRTPALMECTKESLGAGVMLFAQLGLMVGVNGHGWLIPFNDRKNGCKNAVVVIGYQGMIDLCYRSDRVESITADVICENDEFEFVQGFDQILRHVPNLKGTRGKPYAVYAIANIKDSRRPVAVVLNKEEVMKVKAASPAARKSDSVWNGPFEQEMWKKTALNRLCKLLPKSIELASALDFENKQAQSIKEVNADIVREDPLKAGTSKMRSKPQPEEKPKEKRAKTKSKQKSEPVQQVEAEPEQQSSNELQEAYNDMREMYLIDGQDDAIDKALETQGLPALSEIEIDGLGNRDIQFMAAYEEIQAQFGE